MIFVFLEDGTLDIVEDIAEANKNYESVDVENDVYRFFDAQGNYLEPHFTKPNKYGKFLGLFKWCSSGEYELIPNSVGRHNRLGLSLQGTDALNPNKWFKDLDEVKKYFHNQGIKIEPKLTEP
jgi:hypothetical protein